MTTSKWRTSWQSFVRALSPSSTTATVTQYQQAKQSKEKLRSNIKWLTYSIVGMVIAGIPLYNARMFAPTTCNFCKIWAANQV